jgi:hypothetical protein
VFGTDKNFHLHWITLEPMWVEQVIVFHSLEKAISFTCEPRDKCISLFCQNVSNNEKSFTTLNSCVIIIKLFPPLLMWTQDNKLKCLALTRIFIYIGAHVSRTSYSVSLLENISALHANLETSALAYFVEKVSLNWPVVPLF